MMIDSKKTVLFSALFDFFMQITLIPSGEKYSSVLHFIF